MKRVMNGGALPPLLFVEKVIRFTWIVLPVLCHVGAANRTANLPVKGKRTLLKKPHGTTMPEVLVKGEIFNFATILDRLYDPHSGPRDCPEWP